MSSIKVYEFKKGHICTPDEQYTIPLPFDCYKTLSELYEDMIDGDLEDETLIEIVERMKDDFTTEISRSGIHILIKNIKVTYETY